MKDRWPVDPRRFRWIVDGHNAIFSHPRLERLQTGGERAEARRSLEMMLDRFAAENGVEVLIVYDGNPMERNPDAKRTGRVRTQYSLRPDEEADDRIVYLVEDAIRRGLKPLVVTSDRATLGSRLPAGVLRVDPADLFKRIHASESRPDRSDRPPGDFSDIERHFMSLDEGRASEPASAREPRRDRQDADGSRASGKGSRRGGRQAR